MRFVPIERLKPGMIISQDLYTVRDGQICKERETLTEQLLIRLQNEGIQGTYIDETNTSDIAVWPVISPRIRHQTMVSLRLVQLDGVLYVADQIVTELSKQSNIILEYRDTKSMRDYCYAHNINMGIISCAIGINMNLNRRQLKELTVAAMLCDVGMSHVNHYIMEKEGKLTPEEYDQVRTHAKHSYDMVKYQLDVSEASAMAILHHHENEDGSGYPNGLFSEDIPLFSKILHVADVYDAMISKRSFKEPYTMQEALEYLMGGCGILFDKKVVLALGESVPRYAKGLDVVLNGNTIATVFRNRKDRNVLPMVKTENGKIVDLSNESVTWNTVKPRDYTSPSKMMESERNRREMLDEYSRPMIMVVDDQATNLQVIREMLEEEYNLVLLKSGEQAIKYLDKNKAPDLILMDINMPEMSGIDATRKIHLLTARKVPVLFVSTNHDVKTVLECREVGCAGFVMRPYNEVYIKTEIRRVIADKEG